MRSNVFCVYASMPEATIFGSNKLRPFPKTAIKSKPDSMPLYFGMRLKIEFFCDIDYSLILMLA